MPLLMIGGRLIYIYTSREREREREREIISPAWKRNSFPPAPAASRLTKARMSLTQGWVVTKPWLALKSVKQSDQIFQNSNVIAILY